MKNGMKRASAALLAVLLALVLLVPTLGAETEKILDFSDLNRTPAGEYGFLQADGDQLVFVQGGQKTQARFVGVTYDLSAGIPDAETAAAMAEELYTSGINLVVAEHVYAALKGADGDFSDEKAEAFDLFEYELGLKGIYLYLKVFTPEDLGVAGPDLFFGTETINLTQRFLKRFLSHYNKNKKTYAEDPTVVAIQYASDASLLWMNEGDVLKTGDELQRQFNVWLGKKYASRIDLDNAWTSRYLHKELGNNENFEDGTVRMADIPNGGKEALFDWDAAEVYGRRADTMLFLLETQRNSYAAFEKFMRAQDFKGVLLYGDTSTGPADTALAGIGDAAAKTLVYTDGMTLTDAFCAVASGVISGKPFFFEWDTSASLTAKAEAFLKLTLYSSFQGWDAIILGNYSQQDAAGYNVRNDTDIWSICGLLSNLYRNYYITEADQRIDVVYTESDTICESGLYGKIVGPLVYFSKVGSVFLAGTDVYEGDADVAISSGNTASGDYNNAKAMILHSSVSYTSPYATVADKAVWYNEMLRHVSPLTPHLFGERTVYTGDRIAVATDAVITDLETLSDILHFFPGYEGEAEKDGIAHSDTKQLAYNLKDGSLALSGSRIMILSDDLTQGITLEDFTLQTDKTKSNVVMFTPDRTVFSVGREYIAYIGGVNASDKLSGTLQMKRSDYDCTVYGINADGTQGEQVKVSYPELGQILVELVPEYQLYRFVFEKRAVEDRLVDREPPEPKPKPNLLLLILVPAAIFLSIAVTIVIINENRRAKVEEELRVSSLAAIKKKQAEHKRKISRFDDEE